MSSYKKTLEYLFSQLPMYQRTGPAAYKNTLGNTIVLDKLFGHPHRSFKTIHIAGTNGKGSCSHMLASILQEAGYKTGLYTSPHLIDFRERIRVNGEMIEEAAVVDFVEEFKSKNESKNIEPSFFELTVAMAFDYFKKQRVDIAVIEVGLGGRLDSTNIISPEVGLITNISLDHTNLLGDTIQKIAHEKAGIIKSGIPFVISESNEEYNSIFTSRAKELGSDHFFADQEFNADYAMFSTDEKQIFNFKKNGELLFPNLKLDLLGNYQSKNVGGVLKIIEILNWKNWKINSENIYRGLESISSNTGIKGRWQVVGHNPLIVCDTAHNIAGVKAVVDQIKSTPWEKLHIVLGMVNDKNIEDVLSVLPKNATYYFTNARIPRALPAHELGKKGSKFDLKGEIFSDVRTAVESAKNAANTDDLIFIGGSTFVVADYFS